jgi:hypothetical protein
MGVFKRRRGAKDSSNPIESAAESVNPQGSPVRNVFEHVPAGSVPSTQVVGDVAPGAERLSHPLEVRPIETDFWSSEHRENFPESTETAGVVDSSLPAPAATFRPTPPSPLADSSDASSPLLSDQLAVESAVPVPTTLGADAPLNLAAPAVNTTEPPLVDRADAAIDASAIRPVDVVGTTPVATPSIPGATESSFGWEGAPNENHVAEQPTPIVAATPAVEATPIPSDALAAVTSESVDSSVAISVPTTDAVVAAAGGDVDRVSVDGPPSAELPSAPSAEPTAPLAPEVTRITVDTLADTDSDDDEDDVVLDDDPGASPGSATTKDDVIRIQLTVVDDEISKITIVGSGEDAHEWIDAAAKADKKKKKGKKGSHKLADRE